MDNSPMENSCVPAVGRPKDVERHQLLGLSLPWESHGFFYILIQNPALWFSKMGTCSTEKYWQQASSWLLL